MDSAFHADEVTAQRRAGVGAVRAIIRDFMPAQHREFFALLPYLIIAVPDSAGQPLATVLTGTPGFIASPDPATLRIAARPEPEDPAAEFFREGAAVGLLGIDLATRRRNRANGTIMCSDVQGLGIAVRESFGNCPQYIRRRDVRRVPALPQPAEALTELDADARTLITGADTFFVASRSRPELGGGMDISHRAGPPGFVHIDGNVLTIPDFRGNRYFNTLGNLLGNPHASLLFVDFTLGDVLQLQGLADIDWDGADAIEGSERVWHFRTIYGWRRRAALPLRWDFVGTSPAGA